MKRIAIIGGGAAGLFCAASLSREFDVTVFESSDATLKKVCLTGGGRCNFTNEKIDTGNLADFYPRGAGHLRKPMRYFGAESAKNFFKSLGVKSKTEDEGRVFPVSNDARSIAGALFFAAEKNGVKILTNARVSAVRQSAGGKFKIESSSPATEDFDAVVVAVGGNIDGGLKNSMEDLGIKIEPPAPSLFSIKTADAESAEWQKLQGTAAEDAELKAKFDSPKKDEREIRARGALLMAHFGIGGPATLKFSAFGARVFKNADYKFPFSVNFIPAFDEQERRKVFIEARETFAKRKISNAPLFGLPQKLWDYVVGRAAIGDGVIFANLPKKDEQRLLENLSDMKFECVGKSVHKAEFVTCGGIDRSGIDFSSMKSRKIDNLFFVGECIDIDAVTGGFNLQAAWTTAKICADFINKSGLNL